MLGFCQCSKHAWHSLPNIFLHQMLFNFCYRILIVSDTVKAELFDSRITTGCNQVHPWIVSIFSHGAALRMPLGLLLPACESFWIQRNREQRFQKVGFPQICSATWLDFSHVSNTHRLLNRARDLLCRRNVTTLNKYKDGRIKVNRRHLGAPSPVWVNVQPPAFRPTCAFSPWTVARRSCTIGEESDKVEKSTEWQKNLRKKQKPSHIIIHTRYQSPKNTNRLFLLWNDRECDAMEEENACSSDIGHVLS